MKDLITKILQEHDISQDTDTISTITGVTPEDIQIIINQINEAQKGLEESGALENLKAQGGRIGYRLGNMVEDEDTGGWKRVEPKAPSKDKLRRLLERLKEGLPSFEGIKRNIPSDPWIPGLTTLAAT